MPRLAAILLLPAFLASCVTPPPPTSRDVADPPAVVRERLRNHLIALGFAVTARADGAIVAQTGAALDKFAFCNIVLVQTGNDNSPNRALFADSADADLAATVLPAGTGSRVMLDVRYTGHYYNSASGYWIERPCGPEGALETDLLAVAG